jgi:hypothetical protein
MTIQDENDETLFEADLISPASYATDTLYLMAVGCLAWRVRRAGQMATQYPWLYERTGPLTWRERLPPTNATS